MYEEVLAARLLKCSSATQPSPLIGCHVCGLSFGMCLLDRYILIAGDRAAAHEHTTGTAGPVRERYNGHFQY